MKLYHTISIVINTALLSLVAADGRSWNLRHLESDEVSYGMIYSDDYDAYFDDPDAPTNACIDVKDDDPRDDQKLILGFCRSGWRFDDNGLVHSELDDDQCMQAGRHGKVNDGEFVRMMKCDPSNELQKFYWINGGGIRPQTDTSLCIVWRGVHAHVGVDPIIFKDCIVAEERNDYSGDFPRENYDGPL